MLPARSPFEGASPPSLRRCATRGLAGAGLGALYRRRMGGDLRSQPETRCGARVGMDASARLYTFRAQARRRFRHRRFGGRAARGPVSSRASSCPRLAHQHARLVERRSSRAPTVSAEHPAHRDVREQLHDQRHGRGRNVGPGCRRRSMERRATDDARLHCAGRRSLAERRAPVACHLVRSARATESTCTLSRSGRDGPRAPTRRRWAGRAGREVLVGRC
jgi:hypothetical protein